MRGLILSAGFGERLRPLTLHKAKPAIEFLNVPMLAFPFFWLSRLGLSDIVFNTHHLPDTVREAAYQVVPPGVRTHFSHEEKILGSGGGIWQAQPYLRGEPHFVVTNGDGVILNPDLRLLHEMLDEHTWHRPLATLLVTPREEGDWSGVWVDEDNRVVNFGKTPSRHGLRKLHYASYMIFSQEIWHYLPEGESNILYDVLQPQIEKGALVRAHVGHEILWCETGNAKDYLASTKRCLESIRADNGWGRCALDILDAFGPPFRQQSDFSNLRLIADSAEIADSARIEGFAVIGARTLIDEETRLRDSVVLQDARIKPHSQLENAVFLTE